LALQFWTVPKLNFNFLSQRGIRGFALPQICGRSADKRKTIEQTPSQPLVVRQGESFFARSILMCSEAREANGGECVDRPSNNLSALRAQSCLFFPRFSALGKWAGEVSAANGGMRQSRMSDGTKFENGGVTMSFAQSLLTGVFCMTVVFTALIALWALVRLSSAAIVKLESAKAAKPRGVPAKEQRGTVEKGGMR
jgi:Na+-transporting methylmalonyl-CoA/oxaloacetate decarboxylase gamma subunit